CERPSQRSRPRRRRRSHLGRSPTPRLPRPRRVAAARTTPTAQRLGRRARPPCIAVTPATDLPSIATATASRVSNPTMRRVLLGVVLFAFVACGNTKISPRPPAPAPAPARTNGPGQTTEPAIEAEDAEATTTSVLACGKERWPVKTGTDLDVSAIDTANVQQTT